VVTFFHQGVDHEKVDHIARTRPRRIKMAQRRAGDKDPRRDKISSPPVMGIQFHIGEKKIPGAPGQVVPPGPPKSGPAGTGLSQLI
jgi:hypothetical protein